MAFAFGFAAIRMVRAQSPIMSFRFENVESISDIELPEITIECDTNPYWLGRCWSARYDNNNVFLGCEFSGRSDSSCFGEIYKP